MTKCQKDDCARYDVRGTMYRDCVLCNIRFALRTVCHVLCIMHFIMRALYDAIRTMYYVPSGAKLTYHVLRTMHYVSCTNNN